MVHFSKWGLAWLSRNSAPGLLDGDHVCETLVRKMVMIPPPCTHRMLRDKLETTASCLTPGGDSDDQE